MSESGRSSSPASDGAAKGLTCDNRRIPRHRTMATDRFKYMIDLKDSGFVSRGGGDEE